MDESRLLELDRLAVESVSALTRRRFAYRDLRERTGRPFEAIVGPRGAGKTVILRQLRSDTENSLYISADTLDHESSLSELIARFHSIYAITHFYIDEIHFITDYERQLKEVFDFLPVRVWLTSSVALSLTSAGWDLSRRVHRTTLLPFSFREYLWFLRGDEYEPLSIKECTTGRILAEYLRALVDFQSYLTGGLHPFMLEPGATTDLFGNIISKIVTQDIPRFDPQLTTDDIDKIEKTVQFIGKSGVDGINYSSISRNVGVTKYKAEKYLDYLERSFVVRRVFPAGTNVLKEPKVLMQLPYRLLYHRYEDCIGGLREDFFSLAMGHHAQAFTYAKTTRGGKTPDYVLEVDEDTTVVEIGGRGKGRTQFKELIYDRKTVLFHGDASGYQPGSRVPLHCVGFA